MFIFRKASNKAQGYFHEREILIFASVDINNEITLSLLIQKIVISFM